MWINRSKFERMERDIDILKIRVDNLTDCVKSLERINEYAGDEPTFRVGEKIKTNSADDGLVVYIGCYKEERCIYLYIDKHEYIINAPELPSVRYVDYERSRLKIDKDFAYIDVCINNRLYKYVSQYKNRTRMYIGCEDILKRDEAEEVVTYESDPYRFHDLRKDPTDLPEKYGEDWVLVKLSITGFDGVPVIAEYRNGIWYHDSIDKIPYDSKNILGWFKIYDPCLSSRKNPSL